MGDQTDLREQSLDNEPGQERSKSRTWGLVSTGVVIVVIILILLMLPRCGSVGSGGGAQGGKSIIPVPKSAALPGLVSVWIEPKTSIGAVLKGAGVGSAPIELESGKFVVTVPAGREANAVKRLKAQPGVYDAGRVYEAPGTK
jgi:hypothetical protein